MAGVPKRFHVFACLPRRGEKVQENLKERMWKMWFVIGWLDRINLAVILVFLYVWERKLHIKPSIVLVKSEIDIVYININISPFQHTHSYRNTYVQQAWLCSAVGPIKLSFTCAVLFFRFVHILCMMWYMLGGWLPSKTLYTFSIKTIQVVIYAEGWPNISAYYSPKPLSSSGSSSSSS